ncbi:MAG: hypothetical protein HYR85_22820 [Planctomycetes bacterium]|nr:hypothetical protein [Planctomycetota bacterium]MBI3844372.1 hypothetical protein [Planctomycetota bacterium]
MRLERVAEARGKPVFLAFVDSIPDAFDRAGLPGRFFHLLVCVDEPIDAARFRAFARELLKAGAVHVVTIGSAAEAAHDLFDEAIIDGDFFVDDSNAIRTIELDEEEEGETLEDAARILVADAFTTEECERDRGSALAIVIGDSAKRARLSAALAACG